MKISEIVQLKRDLNNAIDAAGKGEFRWFTFLEKLDELGYDLTRRAASPGDIATVVKGIASISDADYQWATKSDRNLTAAAHPNGMPVA